MNFFKMTENDEFLVNRNVCSVDGDKQKRNILFKKKKRMVMLEPNAQCYSGER